VLELIIQQTNSTVTTTILQQPNGWSFLDVSLSDWVLVFSSLAMVAVTIALAYYARVAIVEAKNDRRKDSIEKQLEKLFSPMFEILDTAGRLDVTPESPRPTFVEEGNKYRVLANEDIANLWTLLLNYGHYLDPTEHDKMRTLLSTEPKEGWGTSLYFPEADYNEWLGFAAQKREQLRAELRTLS
jgi:hypothetical protein